MFRALVLCLLLAMGCSLSAQDIVFSQFYAAPLRLNPALTGIGIAPRITANYRSQHLTYPAAFTTPWRRPTTSRWTAPPAVSACGC